MERLLDIMRKLKSTDPLLPYLVTLQEIIELVQEEGGYIDFYNKVSELVEEL